MWKAFNELHRARQSGFSVNAIQYSDIDAWLNINSIYDPDERKYFFDVIIQVDSEFITWARKKEETERKKKPVPKRK